MDKDEKDAIILIILSLLSCGYFFFISSNDWSKDGEMVLRGEKKKPESERRNWTYRNLPVSHTPFFFHLRPNRDLATRLHSRNSIKLAKLWWQRWCLSEKLREFLAHVKRDKFFDPVFIHRIEMFGWNEGMDLA